MKTTYHLIGRGFAGWHARGLGDDNCAVSSSGGNIDPYKYWTGVDCLGYRQEAIDGAIVYDAAHLEDNPTASKEFIHFVFAGPMFDPSLKANQINRFNDRQTIEVDNLDALTFGFDGADIRGLDMVGSGVYLALLKRIPGIKLGTVKDKEVIWFD